MRRSNDHLYDLLGEMVRVVIDRPIGTIHKGMTYPVNYGYIPGLIGGDGEPQDAYILGLEKPVTSFDGQVIGVIRRHNDCEDKLVVAPEGTVMHQGEIAAATAFQEQFFETSIDCVLRKSCGVIPYCIAGGETKYLIVYEQFSQCWSLPKGHMEAGETEVETALRELFEETGLTAELDTSDTASIEYPISPRSRKQVIFFLGAVRGTPRARDGEIEKYKWVKAEELKDYLFPDTVAAIEKLIANM